MYNAKDTEQMVMIRESAREFAKTHIKPFVMEWDEKQYFPVELFSLIRR